jgi:hypothetical protein
MIEERQSTTVPKTSNVKAFTELATLFWENANGLDNKLSPIPEEMIPKAFRKLRF